MISLSRSMPLRWLYPLLGALIAATGAALLYATHADALFIGALATLVVVAAGFLLGRRWDSLRETAVTDPLTGVANRAFFDQRLHRSIQAAVRAAKPLTLLFVDVDHLKVINDELGHGAGDAALKLVGETLAHTCRSRDLVARWGGDEFAILAEWTTCREGLILGHRIRETLAQLSRRSATSPCPTVSIGVAELTMVEAPRADALLHAADDALYLAKAAGRDRVSLAPPASAVRPRGARRRRQAMANLRTRPLRIPDETTTRH